MREFAVFFDPNSRVWELRASDEFGSSYMVFMSPTFEDCLQQAAVLSGAPVGISLIVRKL